MINSNIVGTMSARIKNVFTYIAVNKNFMIIQCGPTWVCSLCSWTRERPLVQIENQWPGSAQLGFSISQFNWILFKLKNPHLSVWVL